MAVLRAPFLRKAVNEDKAILNKFAFLCDVMPMRQGQSILPVACDSGLTFGSAGCA